MSLATARLSASLTHAKVCPLCGSGHEQPSTVTVGNLSIDQRTRTMDINGTELRLTSKEYELLLYMAQRAGELVSKKQLYLDVWGFQVMPRSTRTVDSHVSRLRCKINAIGANASVVIDNVWGSGWRLRGLEVP